MICMILSNNIWYSFLIQEHNVKFVMKEMNTIFIYSIGFFNHID